VILPHRSLIGVARKLGGMARARVYDIPGMTPPIVAQLRRSTDVYPIPRPAGFFAEVRWGWHRFLHDKNVPNPWNRLEFGIYMIVAVTGYVFLLPLDTFGASQAYRAYREFFNHEWFWGLVYAGPTTWGILDIIRHKADRLNSQLWCLCLVGFIAVVSLLSRSPTAGFILYVLFLWALYWARRQERTVMRGGISD
jgi:hypothetical protein